jgi:formylglycine-generating enzyme required for sulfatase activity
VTEPRTPVISISPAFRSALIIGGLFFAFILLAVFGVLHEAQRIKREREQTKALNSQSSSGEMVWIPEGKITMGAIDGAPDEQPMHDVKVRGFWMDKTEVTNEQFARFVKETGYITVAERKPEIAEGATVSPERREPGAWVFTPPKTADASSEIWRYVPGANWRHPEGPASNIEGREKYPLVQVCWDDAAAFARWAGKRLPTEAEWEYAARGGTVHAPFIWGNELKPGGRWEGNIWQGRFPLEDTAEDGFAGLAPVGRYRTNDYGLADMAGNAWEWCADWYAATYYKKSPHANPPGPEKSDDPDEPSVPKRVARGGSYLSSETNGAGYRPSARRKAAPGYAACDLGFRCARSLQ